MKDIMIHSLNAELREKKQKLSLVNARLVKNNTNDNLYYNRYSVHCYYDIS